MADEITKEETEQITEIIKGDDKVSKRKKYAKIFSFVFAFVIVLILIIVKINNPDFSLGIILLIMFIVSLISLGGYFSSEISERFLKGKETEDEDKIPNSIINNNFCFIVI